jgi:ATP-dependent RNA helicase DDX18/HAS1
MCCLRLAHETPAYSQVSTVVKSLAHSLKFRTACFTGLSDQDAEKRKLRMGTDVLVSTPGRLLRLVERSEVDLSEVAVAVLDEADVLLMDESFPLQPIGQACGSALTSNSGSSSAESSKTGISGPTGVSQARGTQFVFVTATLPDVVVKQIHAEFPDVLTLTGPGLHRVAPSVEEVLVDCSGAPTQGRTLDDVLENKRRALLRAIADVPTARRTIVFCNTIEQCRRVENMLQRGSRKSTSIAGAETGVRAAVGYSTYAYHSAIDPATREANLREFSRPLLRQPAVLVCTDRASRGMDFSKAQVCRRCEPCTGGMRRHLICLTRSSCLSCWLVVMLAEVGNTSM